MGGQGLDGGDIVVMEGSLSSPTRENPGVADSSLSISKKISSGSADCLV